VPDVPEPHPVQRRRNAPRIVGEAIAPRPDRPWITVDRGIKIVKDYYIPKDGARPYWNWIITCIHHADCYKSRRISGRQTSKHGLIEPAAFLNAWIDVQRAPNKTHRATDPTNSQVQRWMDTESERFMRTWKLDLTIP